MENCGKGKFSWPRPSTTFGVFCDKFIFLSNSCGMSLYTNFGDTKYFRLGVMAPRPPQLGPHLLTGVFTMFLCKMVQCERVMELC